MSSVPSTSPETPTDPTHLQGGARTKLVWSLMLTSIALYSCYTAAIAVLLPAQIALLDPEAKEGNLAIVTAISSFATLFVQPIVGTLSDRTRSRLGRRAPWMLGGAALGGIMLALIPVIGVNVAFIAVAWVLAQVSLNGAQGPLSALVADRLDPNYRATASAFMGVGGTLGMTLGVVVSGLLVNHLGLGYLFFGSIVIIGTALLVIFNQDKSSATMPVEAFSWRDFIAGFGRPFRSGDFRWAFAQRFVMFFGYMGVTGYMFYILMSYVGLSLVEAGAFMGVQQVASSVASVVSTLVAGRLSDRIGRRKIFILIASALIAIGCVAGWLMPTTTGILIFAVFAGLGFGSYLAVDVALVVDILPNPAETAKDLGVINIANNVPSMLAPIANAFLIGAFGYVGLWPWAIALVFTAGLLVLPIKGVK